MLQLERFLLRGGVDANHGRKVIAQRRVVVEMARVNSMPTRRVAAAETVARVRTRVSVGVWKQAREKRTCTRVCVFMLGGGGGG